MSSQELTSVEGYRSQRVDNDIACFLVEAPDHDVSPAEEFGQIVQIFDRVSYQDTARGIFEDKLLTVLSRNKFDPTVDFVIVTGRMNIMVLAVAVILKHYQSCNLLMFDSRAKIYTVKEI